MCGGGPTPFEWKTKLCQFYKEQRNECDVSQTVRSSSTVQLVTLHGEHEWVVVPVFLFRTKQAKHECVQGEFEFIHDYTTHTHRKNNGDTPHTGFAGTTSRCDPTKPTESSEVPGYLMMMLPRPLTNVTLSISRGPAEK